MKPTRPPPQERLCRPPTLEAAPVLPGAVPETLLDDEPGQTITFRREELRAELHEVVEEVITRSLAELGVSMRNDLRNLSCRSLPGDSPGRGFDLERDAWLDDATLDVAVASPSSMSRRESAVSFSPKAAADLGVPALLRNTQSFHRLVPCAEDRDHSLQTSLKASPKSNASKPDVLPMALAQLGRSARASHMSTSSFLSSSSSPGDRGYIHRLLERVVKSAHFDWVVCLLISLNAISIGIQTDHMARTLTPTIPGPLRAIETTFFVLFLCELLLRLYVFRARFFVGTGWSWNIFDFCIILLQLAEEVLAIFDSDQAEVMQGVSISRLIRIVRLVRMFRFMRILRLVRELRMLVGSISSSLRPFSWTAALLLIMIFMVSLYITQLVADHRIATGDAGDRAEELTHYWGSLDRSMLSLFESITGGMDWDTLIWPLAQPEFHITPVVFLLYIAFSILAIMNVVTGLFIDSVLRHGKAEKENYIISAVHELFQSVEGGIDGNLTWQDFEAKMRTKQMQSFFKDMDIEESDARGLFVLMDLDGSGSINLNEFLGGCLKLRGPAKALDTAVIIEEVSRLAQIIESLKEPLPTTTHSTSPQPLTPPDTG